MFTDAQQEQAMGQLMDVLTTKVSQRVRKTDNSEIVKHTIAHQRWLERGPKVIAEAQRLANVGKEAEATLLIAEYNSTRPRRQRGRPKTHLPSMGKLRSVLFRMLAAQYLQLTDDAQRDALLDAVAARVAPTSTKRAPSA